MKKKIKKIFTIADYLEEEKFLEDQHRNGWKMVNYKVPLSTYVFESCEPEEYVYQLDFNQDKKDESAYLQLFEDCGWEYFNKYSNWYYFRKLKDKSNDDNSIFSDSVSRAEMATKISRVQLGLMISATLPSFIALNILLGQFEKNHYFGIVAIVYMLFIIVIISIHLRVFSKLRRIIKEEQ